MRYSTDSSIALISYVGMLPLCYVVLRGCADKSLARPRRKQATATKLGIYSTYSPRSSVPSYPIALPFASHSKKKIQKVVRPTRSPRQQWPPRRTKNGDLSIGFSVQGTGGSPTGPDPENRVGDQHTGSPGRPGSSGHARCLTSSSLSTRTSYWHTSCHWRIFLRL